MSRLTNEFTWKLKRELERYKMADDADAAVKAIEQLIRSETVTINNEFMPQEHTLYGLDGEPLCTLECMCDKCLGYFSNL
jgi:hypothetical protein